MTAVYHWNILPYFPDQSISCFCSDETVWYLTRGARKHSTYKLEKPAVYCIFPLSCNSGSNNMLWHVVYYGLPQWSHKNKQISLTVTNNEKFWVEMQIPFQVNFLKKVEIFILWQFFKCLVQLWLRTETNSEIIFNMNHVHNFNQLFCFSNKRAIQLLVLILKTEWMVGKQWEIPVIFVGSGSVNCTTTNCWILSR